MMKNMQITSDDFLGQGQVWIAPVWSYRDKKFKPRPVVIVGNESANDKLDVVLNFITSQVARGDYDVELTFRGEAGLDVPSWVRTAKPFTIQKSQLRTQMIERHGVQQPKGYIGRLNDIDLANVIEMCRLVY
ncbi:MAG: type II toxin-antitoxin system PemK/MazF family toxin [Bacillota bacterium]